MPLSLSQTTSEVFVADGTDAEQALARTTHLAVGAHPDDLEIMAAPAIVACTDSATHWFTGVVATDGAGGSTSGRQTPHELAATRRAEQKRAAVLGRYGALVLLDHSSPALKSRASAAVVADFEAILRVTRPDVLYTHNLADAHDTHVAVALDVIAACRCLSPSERPPLVIGCEVWRGLDWLPGASKVAMPVDDEELERALIRCFASQLGGGKHYDEAALGRRRANATFDDAREPDRHAGIVWGMDLTPAAHGDLEPLELVRAHLTAFEADVTERIRRHSR